MSDGAPFQRGSSIDVGEADDLHPVPEQPGGVVGDLHPLAVLAAHGQIGEEGAEPAGRGGQRRVELAEIVLPAQGAGEIVGEQALVQAGVDVLAAAVALAHQQGGGDGLDGDVGGAVAGVRAGAVGGGLAGEGHAEIDVRAGAGFDDAVVRGKPGQLAGAAERGDGAVHEARIPRGERLVAERPAQAGRPALGLEQHVRRVDQGAGRVAVRGQGWVEHDAARTPVP